MFENKPDENSSIVKFQCAQCKKNTIYIKFLNHETNEKPFQGKNYSCTECSQGLTQTQDSSAN